MSICDNIFHLQRSSQLPQKRLHRSDKNEKWLERHQSHIQKKSSLLAVIFAVLMYSLYHHPRNFKLQ